MNFSAQVLQAILKIFCGCTVRRFPRLSGAGPFLFYANHTSNLDFPVVWAALPSKYRERVRPVAAADYWLKTPLRRYLAVNTFHALLIERRKVTRQSNPIPRIVATLEKGNSALIFPEGTRHPDGELGTFKSGIYHIAKAVPGVPLIPVHLDNLSRILPKGELLPLPIVASVTFGDPFRLDLSADRETCLRACRDALLALRETPEEVPA